MDDRVFAQVGGTFELYDTYHNTEEMASMSIIENEITISQ